MVLAAGHGTRLRPLTFRLPKPAIPVLGRPMIVQTLRRLAASGFDPVVVNLHHLPAVVRATIAANADDALPTIVFSREDPVLGTAGGLRHAAVSLRGEGPILVCNGDFLADIDCAAAIEHHRRSGRTATLVLGPERAGYSVVETASDGTVLSLAGTPVADPKRVAARRMFTGCHVMNESVLDRIPASGPSDIVRHVYRDLAARDELGSWFHDGFWWEFGSPELYLDGSLRLIDGDPAGALDSIEHDPIRRIEAAVCAVGPGAEIDPSARLRGRVAVGMAVRIGAGCAIEDSVVMPEAWVGPDCRLRRSIVGPGAELAAGFEASDTLICADDDRLTDDELPSATRRSAGLLVHALSHRGT